MWWQLSGFAACDAAVVVCPSTEWAESAKNAQQSVSRATAQVCFVACRGLAMEAVVPADVGCGPTRTLKCRGCRIDSGKDSWQWRVLRGQCSDPIVVEKGCGTGNLCVWEGVVVRGKCGSEVCTLPASSWVRRKLRKMLRMMLRIGGVETSPVTDAGSLGASGVRTLIIQERQSGNVWQGQVGSAFQLRRDRAQHGGMVISRHQQPAGLGKRHDKGCNCAGCRVSVANAAILRWVRRNEKGTHWVPESLLLQCNVALF